jgi:hypothetical protein
MKLSGGGAQARRGEEVSKDWCGGGRLRASAFHRGRREAEATRKGGGAVNGALHWHHYWERRGRCGRVTEGGGGGGRSSS